MLFYNLSRNESYEKIYFFQFVRTVLQILPDNVAMQEFPHLQGHNDWPFSYVLKQGKTLDIDENKLNLPSINYCKAIQTTQETTR